MVKIKQQTLSKHETIINASEIGQYHYCSKAWYLQKCGYKPESAKLDVVTKRHVELGKIMDHTQANIKKSRVLAIVGYLILIVALLILLFGVIL